MGGLRHLISLERNWIPTHPGSSLYIRPFMFANDEHVGIKAADNYKFVIFCSPVNHYYSEPLKVKVEQHYVRAVKGGIGDAKTAGNYAASLYSVTKAHRDGY